MQPAMTGVARAPGAFWIAMGGLLTAGPALADGAAILRCRQLAEPAQRLACYEAIVVPTAGAVAQTPPPAPASPDLPQVGNFGLEVKSALVGLPSTMESTIPGRFLGWGPNDTITLANGQVWQVSDDSRGALASTDPKVTIRRGALGAFYLEIAGTNRSPKVRRVR
jgi:hypothetical protein